MVRLSLLGTVRIEGPSGAVPGYAAQRRQLALLGLLATAGRTGLSRDKVQALLWPDRSTESARHSLSDALHRLRRALGEDCILAEGDSLLVNPDVVRTDVGVFESCLERGDLEGAADAWRGPFMDGFHFGSSSEFEDWRSAEAARLGRALEEALEKLAESAEADGDARKAAGVWARLAGHDLLNTRRHVRWMRALAASGDSGNAIQVGQAHVALLRAELGAEPPAELLPLLDDLRTGRAAAGAAAPQDLCGPEGRPSSIALAPMPRPSPSPAARTGKGRRRLLIAGALLSVAGLGLWVLGRRSPGSAPASGPAGGRPAIAVLPCENLSPDSADAYLAPSIHDELLVKLGGISALRVIGRQSVEWYRQNPRPVPAIASELGVGYVGECDVQKDPTGPRIRLRFRLTDTSGTQLWADAYDQELTPESLYGMQAALAQEVAYRLRIAISPEEKAWLDAVPTHDLRALEAYMRGNEWLEVERQAGIGGTWEGLPSIQFFESAVEIDPNFAVALARLAYSGTATFNHTQGAPERVEALAQRALAIFPDLPEARIALAHVRRASGDMEGAVRELDLADRISPGDPDVALLSANIRRMGGDFHRAIEIYEAAQRRDPLDPRLAREIQYSYLHAHRYDDALKAFAREIALLKPLPRYTTVMLRPVFIHLARGDTAKAEVAAEEAFQRTPEVFYNYNYSGPLRVAERVMRPELRDSAFAASMASGMWENAPGETAFEVLYANKAIHEAALGHDDVARVYWDSLRIDFTRAPRPSAGVQLRGLGLAYLGLEDETAAIETGRRFLEEAAGSDCRSGFQEWGWRSCALLARIYAHFGHPDDAVDLLEQLLPAPSWLTVNILEIDPVWAPLRGHPRFEALLKRYADDVEH